jgi:siroheme synthase
MGFYAVLLDGGRAPDTPVALVRWGTTHAQETVTVRLGKIATQPDAVWLAPPVVIVVGEVVALRERLAGLVDAPAEAGAALSGR